MNPLIGFTGLNTLEPTHFDERNEPDSNFTLLFNTTADRKANTKKGGKWLYEIIIMSSLLEQLRRT